MAALSVRPMGKTRTGVGMSPYLPGLTTTPLVEMQAKLRWTEAQTIIMQRYHLIARDYRCSTTCAAVQ